MRAICAVFTAASLALASAGCGDKGPAEPVLELVPASGVVTLDGKPLAEAQVTFLFEGTPPKGFVSSGAKTGPDGKFTVKTGSKPGTVVGAYKVIVSLLKSPDGSPVKIDVESGMDLEQLQQAGQVKESIAEQFNNPETTELHANVEKAGKNEFEFKLTGS